MALSLSSRSAHVPAINMRVLDFRRVSKLDPGLRFETPAGICASARARLERKNDYRPDRALVMCDSSGADLTEMIELSAAAAHALHGCGEPAIHHQQMSIHIGAGIRGEKNCRAADLLRLAPSTERRALFHPTRKL